MKVSGRLFDHRTVIFGSGAGPRLVRVIPSWAPDRCVEVIRKQIAVGRLKLSNFLDEINVSYLTEDEMQRYDPELRSFANANTPQEWRQMAQRAGRSEV